LVSKPVPLERTHAGTEGRSVILLDEEYEYADNVEGIIICVMPVEMSLLRHTLFLEVVSLTRPMDFLSKRINASRPLYFY